ncbi:Peroxisomal targeting signal 1 receptor [Leucoagaricus sp. SymC.cos]|nr:Peroxisomal targeting signal 1 receptor [Leucoagaricus sp. SymC.cos]
MLFSGGAECGPSNPLQGLSKRFDQDRGIQQDQFGASRASSSRDAFRTQTGPSGPDADAARFFNSSTPTAIGALGLSTAFDVSAMRAALPPASVQTPQLQAPAPTTAGWATDFMNMSSDLGGLQQKQQMASTPIAVQTQPTQQGPHASIVHSSPPLMQNWSPMGFGMRGFMPQTPMQEQQQQQPLASNSRLDDQISWDKEFSEQERHLASTIAEQSNVEETRSQPAFEGDELARTAGMLIENLKHETNPKFKNSQFMGLMKQIRDGEVVVDGNNMVENDGLMRNSEQINGSKDKGKERAFEPSPNLVPITDSPMFRVPHQHELPRKEKEKVGEEVDPNDAYFRQENADFTKYWQEFNERMAPGNTLSINAQEKEWDTLQGDWDRFEATSSGIRQLNVYQFQDNNPYLLGDSSKTRHHAMHSGMSSLLESVLELEAAVQRDMTNARAWYELGIKQQENEREQKALQALERAVELDPTHLPVWLALGISYTNDNNRRGTYDAVEEWVKRNERYSHLPYDASSFPNLTMNERYAKLVDHLIAMARSDTAGEIDVDTQIALAVLLNTNEDYQKAQDCFRTALAIRPDDWLLYNRVGATMANSGRAEEALQYYYKALELNPGYIRARFNLGISCINLRRISYNTRYFSGNYGLIVALLAVYAVLTNYLLLIAMAFLVGGFALINKFAPDATQFGEHTVTQKHLYTGLFVIGIPLLWLASPIGTIFWIVGASAVLILGHACLIEPGVESDYAAIDGETV